MYFIPSLFAPLVEHARPHWLSRTLAVSRRHLICRSRSRDTPSTNHGVTPTIKYLCINVQSLLVRLALKVPLILPAPDPAPAPLTVHPQFIRYLRETMIDLFEYCILFFCVLSDSTRSHECDVSADTHTLESGKIYILRMCIPVLPPNNPEIRYW